MSLLHGSSRAFQDPRGNGSPAAEGTGNAGQIGVARSGRTGSEQTLRKIIRTRAERGEFLPAYLFADPAWDMLLDLYLADILSQRVSITSLCSASKVPPTTALRWMGTLQGEGLIERAADPYDHRRYYVSLSESGLAAMDDFFGSQGVRAIH